MWPLIAYAKRPLIPQKTTTSRSIQKTPYQIAPT